MQDSEGIIQQTANLQNFKTLLDPLNLEVQGNKLPENRGNRFFSEACFT